MPRKSVEGFNVWINEYPQLISWVGVFESKSKNPLATKLPNLLNLASKQLKGPQLKMHQYYLIPLITRFKDNLARTCEFIVSIGPQACTLLIHTLVFNSDLLSFSTLIYLFWVFSHFVLHEPFVGFLKVIATELDFNGVNISVCYLVF